MAGIGYTSENKFGATVLIAAVGIAMIIGVLATMLFMTMRSNNHAATTPPNDSDFAAIAATSSSTTTSTPMTVTTTIAPTTTAAPPTTTTIAQRAELEARVQRRFKAVTNGNVDDAWALTSDVCKDGTTYNQFEAEVQYQSQNNNGLTIVSIDKIDMGLPQL